MYENNKDRQQGFAAVKPEEKKFDKMVIGGIVLVIIIILGAVGYWIWGVDRGDKDSSESKDSNQEQELVFPLEEENKEEVQESDNNDSNKNYSLTNIAYNSGTASVIGGLSNFYSVKVAVLGNPDVFDYKNDTRGCDDEIVLAERKIAPTAKVLNGALYVLFNEGNDYGFKPGNFIASQKDLKFKEAIIENKIAKIYLSGKVGPINGVCDIPRIEAQIEETALQFDTVNAVEIYLNNEPLKVE